MSLITCCPACGTMFKVVADQLKISDGWVRCGHCAQVFDAPAHMVSGGPAPATSPQAIPATPAVAPPPALARREPAPMGEAAPPMPLPVRPAATPVPVAPVRDEPLDEAPWTPVAMRDTTPSDFPPGDAGAAVEELPVFGAENLRQAEADAAEAGAELKEVSFMRDARRRAFWGRPLVRACLVLVLLVLAAGLAAQVAVHERDRLAAMQPGLKPWLEQACSYLGCKVGATRQIEAVAIDSSSFSKLRADTYRLAFTLKNGAPIPIATPSMELTLTDTQEQAVVRRVLGPAELGAPGALLPAGGEWAASVTLSVAASGGGGRIAGYRLLAFYP